LRHSDQLSFFHASKLPSFKLLDDEVERHVRPDTQLVQQSILRRFFFVPQSLKPIALPLNISAKHFPNAILNPHPAQKSFRLGAYVLGAATTGTLISTWAEIGRGEEEAEEEESRRRRRRSRSSVSTTLRLRIVGLSRRINYSPIPLQLEPEIA
jgi:hypothetical protein